MGELSRAGQRGGQQEPITGSAYTGSSYTKTFTVNALADKENFILYAENDGVHTDTPNVLAIRRTGASIRAVKLYYSDGKYMVGTESCQMAGGTFSANSYFRKSCVYRYIAW